MYTTPHPLAYYFYPLLDVLSTDEEIGLFKSSIIQKNCGSDKKSLIYIHIPFCNDLCKFCPFHVKVKQDKNIHEKYVDALVNEIITISRVKYLSDRVYDAVYFGGGSPSILTTDLIKLIFETLSKYLVLSESCEISFEGEPKGLSQIEQLECLKEYKVSRISFGLQTYDQELRDLFNIDATLDDISLVMENARKLQFEEINADFMYDLPGQTISTLMYDLERVLRDQFDSVDYYNLHYYAFPKQMRLDFKNDKLPTKPSDTMHLALFNEVDSFLQINGYKNVADQIYSKFDEPSEFYKILWGGGNGVHDAETIGIGASSRGYLDGQSYMNIANTSEYVRYFTENDSLPILRVSSKLIDPKNRGLVHFPKFFEMPLEMISSNEKISGLFSKWEAEGYVGKNDRKWFMTQYGKRWTNNMMRDIFEPEQLKIADRSLNELIKPFRSRTGTF